MSTTIRPATKNDAQAIVDIIENCFGEEIEAQHTQSVIGEDDHATFVAEVDGKVVGFVDNFITIAQDGTRRCELDLLGVHVEYRGFGLGKKLIEASTKAGQDFGATTMRVLVAATNTAMYYAMNKMGYQQRDEICRLYVSSAQGNQSTLPDTAYLIPVNTLSYRGIWLEGEVSPDALHAANIIREKQGWDVIGIVTPAINDAQIEIIEAADFKLVGNYYRWYKAI